MASALTLVKNKKSSKTLFQGLAFLEFSALQPERLHNLLKNMGFQSTQKHRRRDLTLYKQGNIRFLLNAEPDGFAASFASARGTAVCGMGIYVQDALEAFAAAVDRGAIPLGSAVSSMEAHIPVVHGPGDTLLYFIECGDGGVSTLDLEFKSFPSLDLDAKTGAELTDVHHIHFSLTRSDIPTWSAFFQDILGFSLYTPFETEGFLAPLREGATLVSPLNTLTLTFQEHLSLPASFTPHALLPLPPTGVEFVSLQSRNLMASVHTFWRKNITLLPQIMDMGAPDTIAPEPETRLAGRGENMPTDAARSMHDGAFNTARPLLSIHTSQAHNRHLQEALASFATVGATMRVSPDQHRTASDGSGGAIAIPHSSVSARQHTQTNTQTHTNLPVAKRRYLWGMPDAAPRTAGLAQLARHQNTLGETTQYATLQEYNQNEALLETLDLLGEYISFHTERLGTTPPKTTLRAQTHSLMGSFFFEFQQEVSPALLTPIDTRTPAQPLVAADPFGLSALWGV